MNAAKDDIKMISSKNFKKMLDKRKEICYTVYSEYKQYKQTEKER